MVKMWLSTGPAEIEGKAYIFRTLGEDGKGGYDWNKYASLQLPVWDSKLGGAFKVSQEINHYYDADSKYKMDSYSNKWKSNTMIRGNR